MPAILSEIVLDKFKINGLKNCQIEGKESGDWKLIDGKDIVVHIFNPEKRRFYDLEKMWSELIPVSYTHLTLPTTPYV